MTKRFCPHCGLPAFFVPFDYGRLGREAGRHDAGETPHCEVHGQLDERDLIEEAALAQVVAEAFEKRQEALCHDCNRTDGTHADTCPEMAANLPGGE